MLIFFTSSVNMQNLISSVPGWIKPQKILDHLAGRFFLKKPIKPVWSEFLKLKETP